MNWQQLHSSRIVSMAKPKENHVYIKDILAPWYYRSKFDIDYLIAWETFSSRTQNKKGQKNIMSLLHYRETHGHIPCNMSLKFVYYTRLKSRKRAQRYEKTVCFWIPLIYESLISHFDRKRSGDFIPNKR